MKQIVKQQPFKKVSKTPKNLFIKIQHPLNSPPSLVNPKRYQSHSIKNINVLQTEIRQAHGRVVEGKLALQLSRKQQSSPQKLVQSDRMGLVFSHDDKGKKTNMGRLDLQMVYERGDETEREQGEGYIQLPLHIQGTSASKESFSSRNQVDKFQSSRATGTNRTNKKVRNLSGLEEFMMDRSKEKGIPRRQLFKSSQEYLTATRELKEEFKPVGSKHNKQVFARTQQIIRSKEKLNKSLENKPLHKCKIEQYFLNQSHERLPLYMQTDRSIEKQKKFKLVVNHQQKVKIKLNRPFNNSKQSKVHLSSKYNIRPRYHIQVPTIKTQPDSIHFKDQKEDILLQNDWMELKRKVNQYDFVRKYLSETDIFSIYQHLKKNHIKQQKWPLFVVDEAYKKMNLLNLR